MRYPVNNFKTEWNTTAGNGFGVATSYGFHDGVDINDNGGGIQTWVQEYKKNDNTVDWTWASNSSQHLAAAIELAAAPEAGGAALMF